MVVHKPRSQPQYLALMRPFTVELWVAVLVATFVVGGMLWLLQKVWARSFGQRGLNLSTSLLYMWSIMLEEPFVHPPPNITGQMVVGIWWVFCLVITTMYRSSLVAYLSVPINSAPLDTIDQLLAHPDATWGMEPGFGLGWDWFKFNTNPKVQMVFRKLKILDVEEQMKEVMEGNHAFFTWKYYTKTIIAANFTDRYGNTPLHISREEFVQGSTAWGVRKGLPFLEPMDRILDHLVESGLVNYWFQELFRYATEKAREERMKVQRAGTAAGDWGTIDGEVVFSSDSKWAGLVGDNAVVLNLNHLQSAFYILLLGYIVASLVFLTEIFNPSSITPTPSPHPHPPKM
ncbi:ionotropic receptor 21a-like [Procambarus clarkii]|uniref:ionotropic receptor 21a-like n=1 Tax=Procambarus clarkii TaxID=6728 RepID=UPI0037421745